VICNLSSCRCSSFKSMCRIKTHPWIQDLIDDTLWHDFIYRVHFCPPYSCTIRDFSMPRNCSTWCRSLLLSFSTCYLGILGLEATINCILARTSHQRTTSEKRTKALLPKCPLFRGSTVLPCPPWARSCKMAVKCPQPHYRQQHISTNSSIWKHNDFPKPSGYM